MTSFSLAEAALSGQPGEVQSGQRMSFPLELERNDKAAALRWVEQHFADFQIAPSEDAIAILLQLQDDPDELEAEFAELLDRCQRRTTAP